MFLTPDDQTPFFGGTYFPPQPRHGLPAFAEVLQRVAEYYSEHRSEILHHASAIRATYDKLVPPPAAAEQELDGSVLSNARAALERDFDRTHGGFGDAPKFPHPTSIERLLRHWRRTRPLLMSNSKKWSLSPTRFPPKGWLRLHWCSRARTSA